LQALPQRRPDLRALATGYQAEDQRYRAALLAQFPALNLGFLRTRDASNVNATGLAVSFSLPVFNRNRGNIAIELATRQRLHDEYDVRLTTARNDAQRIVDQQAPDAARARAIDVELAALQQVLNQSDLAYRAGNADVLVYTAARAALLAKQLERITLQQTRMEQQIALHTLLGVDMQDATGKR
jgi:outer membrane protein TolC